MSKLLHSVLVGSVLATSMLGTTTVQAQEHRTKVAVTNLAYEERVQEYFKRERYSESSKLKAKASHRSSGGCHSSGYGNAYGGGYSGGCGGSESGSASVDASHNVNYSLDEGTYSYVVSAELNKFSADIKGELLKSGYFRVIEAGATKTKDTEKVRDIIGRIKKGQFKGADYVLFGTVSSIEWRAQAIPVANTDSASATLSLDLVADFSLINTRTFEVKAAFSASGSGTDVKLIKNNGAVQAFNRGKVISEVSKSLGEDVINQAEDQIAAIEGWEPPVHGGVVRAPRKPDSKVRVFR